MAESASSASTATDQKRPSIRTPDTKLQPVSNMDDQDPKSPRFSNAENPFTRRESLDLDDYFVGPRDLSKHSKWPMFLRMHGSITPKMVLPLLFVGGWATAIVLIDHNVHSLKVESVLLTITGFVISLGLSFRSSTAYERYAEGRRYWGMLITASQTLGRVFWIHADDIAEQDTRDLMLKKLSAMNLVVAFALALKHHLRFEPFADYSDMHYLIAHLDTFSRSATLNQSTDSLMPRKNLFKETGEYLGVSFAASNPRKLLKKSRLPLGNLPLEILNHLAVTADEMVRNKQLETPMFQTMAYNNINMLNDILVGCERVLNTPLPVAYAIAISQITWVYVMLLPFQLIKPLGWVAIPATVAASYIILGLLLIGGEVENPFGQDVNDLPLELYCEQIAQDMDVIASYEKRDPMGFMRSGQNMPLYPISTASFATWSQRSEESLRQAIRSKPTKTFDLKRNKAFPKGGAAAPLSSQAPGTANGNKDAGHMV